MKFTKLERHLSEPRLGKYVDACNKSKTEAKKLYSANRRVCQSFYPVLNLLEIFVRNSISTQLASHFNNADWIISEKDGFMNYQSLKKSHFYLKRCVEKSIRNNSNFQNTGKIISDQTFGFWSALFLPHHYQLLQGSVINAFPNKPSYANRAIVYNHLKKINSFRNRVYHNEPICFKDSSISFENAKDVYESILNLVEWIDPELLSYLSEFDTIMSKINRAESIFLM